eukprot:gnl/MRDRNA2_/MRDRNA2_49123_c0_seq2.p1 gnl/MRDRNA2_/MRDRNA2_49123_c0~~gnl/MRDRNA2_/MRDRNA2_49123_c0_seq2.p1  ORF type:complete len:339 (-),score=65.53 gnl/MRDRNA2_/MRDRNA2_49123_c0_seq2:168-1184(-)
MQSKSASDSVKIADGIAPSKQPQPGREDLCKDGMQSKAASDSTTGADMGVQAPVDVQAEDTIMCGRKVLEVIGQGAFGEVYEAIELKTAERQVIKVTQQSPQAEKEVTMLRAFPTHPNIIQFFDHATSKRHVYLFLQYGGSQDLDQLQQRQVGQRFEIDNAVNHFRGILQGVVHLHKYGVCHLDIKPENVLVGDDNVLRISDLGMSDYTRYPLMRACGSLPFAAPEVLESDICQVRYHGDLADCFSMGVLFFELCSARHSMTKLLGWKNQSNSRLLKDPTGRAAEMRILLSQKHSLCKRMLRNKVENEQALLHAFDLMLNPDASMRSSMEDISQILRA